jgi:hypothetical protein
MSGCCKRCGCEIKGNGFGHELKFLAEESEAQWIWRHVKRLMVLIFNGFKRPEREGFITICHDCYLQFQNWLSG